MVSANNLPTGTILPTSINSKGRETAQVNIDSQGLTDRIYISPNHAIPVIFVPGIMGSPLIATGDNTGLFEKQGKWAWFPDEANWIVKGYRRLNPLLRRKLLSPEKCQALEYSRDADTTTLKKFSEGGFSFTDLKFNNPQNIPVEEMARRGWGSVMITSYGETLAYLENQLRFIFFRGKPFPETYSAIPSNPTEWGVLKGYKKLNDDDLLKASSWRFPVYAVGYNWMDSNAAAAHYLKKRIDAIREDCRQRLKLKCDKVILVTHSMGGLVARMCAKLNPDDILGVVHGEQPAIGAATAYARVRGGWESKTSFLHPIDSIVSMVGAWALGQTGAEVTAVFTAGAGPLELLPNQLYGNDWLKIQHGNSILFSLPRNNNPYQEIYEVPDKWWRLVLPQALVDNKDINSQEKINEEWIKYILQLKKAQTFHSQLATHYHPQTFAHCGVDKRQTAWHTVSWRVEPLRELNTGLWGEKPSATPISNAQLLHDLMMGQNEIRDVTTAGPVLVNQFGIGKVLTSQGNFYRNHLSTQDQPGDATVPAHSSLAPRPHVPFFAELSGFEHQGAYKNKKVKSITLHAIIHLATKAKSLA